MKNTHDRRSLSARFLVLEYKAPMGAAGDVHLPVQGKLFVRKCFGCFLAICLLRYQMCM